MYLATYWKLHICLSRQSYRRRVASHMGEINIKLNLLRWKARDSSALSWSVFISVRSIKWIIHGLKHQRKLFDWVHRDEHETIVIAFKIRRRYFPRRVIRKKRCRHIFGHPEVVIYERSASYDAIRRISPWSLLPTKSFSGSAGIDPHRVSSRYRW